MAGIPCIGAGAVTSGVGIGVGVGFDGPAMFKPGRIYLFAGL